MSNKPSSNAPLAFCPQHTNTRLRFRPGDNPVKSDDSIDIGDGLWRHRACWYCPDCKMSDAHCPPQFLNTNFDTFDTSTPERAQVLAAARDFANQILEHQCGFALFVGIPGTGKTRLASNIVGEMNYRWSLYARQGELTLALRSTYSRKEIIMRKHESDDEDDEDLPTPQPLLKHQKVSILVLDEIGCNPLANDERLLLDELIKFRYDRKRPTILISNLPLDKFKEFIGDALADRIKHAAGNGRFIVQFPGESYRRSTGEDYLKRT